MTKLEDNLTDENEDDDADMRRSFWRILRHKGTLLPSTFKKSVPFKAKPAHSSTPPVPKAVDKPRNKCVKVHGCWDGEVCLKNQHQLSIRALTH